MALSQMYYVNTWLDRVGRSRRDEPWLTERMGLGTTRIVPYFNGQPLIAERDESLAAITLEPSLVRPEAARLDELVLLGVADDVAYFAVELLGDLVPQVSGGGSFQE